MGDKGSSRPESAEAGPSTALGPEQFSDGHLAVGPTPQFLNVPRWATVKDVPRVPLPPIPEYQCRRVTTPPQINGMVHAGVWDQATWSEPFGRIGDGVRAGYETRVALLWDDSCLYAGFMITDPDIRAKATLHHDQLYMTDDVAELFVDVDGGYYEIGVNAINTVYEYRWSWVQRLVENRDWSNLEELLKLPNFLYYTAREADDLGRVGDMDFELPGLQHATQVRGTINAPQNVDESWTVEIAIPWSGLASVGTTPGPYPPTPGDSIRIQAYRAQHDWSDHAGAEELSRAWPGATPFAGHAWSTQGNGNIHNPERWVSVQFVDDAT